MNMREIYAVEAGVEGHVFSEGEGGRKYIYIFIQGDRLIKSIETRFSFNENHLLCRVRIIGYFWVTLNPVKSETSSLDTKLKNRVSRKGFGLHYSVFSLSE